MKKFLFVSLLLCFVVTSAEAVTQSQAPAAVFAAEKKSKNGNLDYLFPSKTVYFGVSVGGGSTEWKYLVDTTDPQNNLDAVTPIAVDEGGPSWGVVIGYDVSKNFAVELQYIQFPNSNITFDEFGQLSYNLNSSTIISKTDAYSLSGKFLVPVGVRTHLRAFAAVGGGVVERSDVINENATCVTPYMSAGLDYNFTRHWILESGFQYYTGFGASQEYPVSSFIPFAWDAYARLAYQI